MQMSEQIIEVLEYLCKKIGVTIDFTNENVLPYLSTLCEKYIHWEIASSIMWIVLSLIGISCIIVAWRFAYKNYKKTDDDMWLVVVSFFGGIFSLLLIALICGRIYEIIQCLTFPEMAICEYITYLLEAK